MCPTWRCPETVGGGVSRTDFFEQNYVSKKLKKKIRFVLTESLFARAVGIISIRSARFPQQTPFLLALPCFEVQRKVVRIDGGKACKELEKINHIFLIGDIALVLIVRLMFHILVV